MKNQTKSEAKKKPGRKASGLRELSPDAARYAVTKEMFSAVQAAEDFRRKVARLPGLTDGAPSLARALKGDLQVASMLVAEDGQVQLQPVLRSTDYEKQLRGAGVPEELMFTAKAFTANVNGATLGKLTATWDGAGGGSSAEPERFLIQVDMLNKATADLNRCERFTVWAALVFGLPLHDIGWSLYGLRITERVRLVERASLHLEAGLERMQPWYMAHA